ncbi:MAG: hypothetical protein ABJA78_12680 [Ferruginibacter sp.]
MLNRLNQYLLTHYPLLWNSKIIWVLLANIIIYFLFFIAGFGSISVEELQKYYSIYSGNTAVFSFSVMCSIATLIFWLVFYLRNNAFKNFYIIDRYHLVKEFFLIFLIILSSLVYFESYYIGNKVRTRALTSRNEMVAEVNTCNLGMAFIPTGKSDYFILNNCNEARNSDVVYNENRDYNDTNNISVSDTQAIRVRAALRLPNAFSYLNYCSNFITLDEDLNQFTSYNWVVVKNRWIQNNNQDSIKTALENFIAVCKKYKIDNQLNINELAALPFANANHSVTKLIKTSEYDNNITSDRYISTYSLQRALEMVEESHGSLINQTSFSTELYFALCFSIMLLCYKRFSKKVFLIGMVGSLVWLIIFGLIGISAHSEEPIGYFFLFLFAAFFIIGISLIKSNSFKNVSGVLLNWHIAMLPFLLMIIIMLMSAYYHDHLSLLYDGFENGTKRMAKDFPISSWVDDHSKVIMQINILFVFLYVAFYFNYLAKKWHSMPEE